MPNFYILTGAPGSGKSTILRELKAGNLTVIDEPAREILSEQRSFKGNGVPETNPDLFTELMLSRAVQQFKQFQDHTSPILFDRGIPDMIGYAALFGIDQKAAQSAAVTYRYNRVVFITPPWKDIYKTDDERKMSFDQAQAFGNDLVDIYRDFGYETVTVPKASPSERALFILNSIRTARTRPLAPPPQNMHY